jgi:hypothetical protein
MLSVSNLYNPNNLNAVWSHTRAVVWLATGAQSYEQQESKRFVTRWSKVDLSVLHLDVLTQFPVDTLINHLIVASTQSCITRNHLHIVHLNVLSTSSCTDATH